MYGTVTDRRSIIGLKRKCRSLPVMYVRVCTLAFLCSAVVGSVVVVVVVVVSTLATFRGTVRLIPTNILYEILLNFSDQSLSNYPRNSG